MNRIVELIKRGFESTSGKSPEYASFHIKLRNDMRKEVEGIGGVLLDCSRGHFYSSGFFMHKYQMYYFSISDVRWFTMDGEYKMLIRTAKGLKDFTGGVNTYQLIKDGMLQEYFKSNSCNSRNS